MTRGDDEYADPTHDSNSDVEVVPAEKASEVERSSRRRSLADSDFQRAADTILSHIDRQRNARSSLHIGRQAESVRANRRASASPAQNQSKPWRASLQLSDAKKTSPETRLRQRSMPSPSKRDQASTKPTRRSLRLSTNPRRCYKGDDLSEEEPRNTNVWERQKRDTHASQPELGQPIVIDDLDADEGPIVSADADRVPHTETNGVPLGITGASGEGIGPNVPTSSNGKSAVETATRASVQGLDASENCLRASRELFVFPQGDARGKVQITIADMRRLSKGEYLNDSLIDFYLKYLSTEVPSSRACGGSRYFCFSSFFFRRLTRTAPVDYAGVQRWTNGIDDIFEHDFLFVPICDSNHWSLIVVVNLPSMAAMVDAMESEWKGPATDRPAVVYLDSLNPSRGTGFAKAMREYMVEEWLFRKEQPNDSADDRIDAIRTIFGKGFATIKPRVPMQTNQFDCGLYLLQNAELFLRNTDGFRIKCFSSSTALASERGLPNAYTHCDVVGLRKRLRLIANRLMTQEARDLKAEYERQHNDLLSLSLGLQKGNSGDDSQTVGAVVPPQLGVTKLHEAEDDLGRPQKDNEHSSDEASHGESHDAPKPHALEDTHDDHHAPPQEVAQQEHEDQAPSPSAGSEEEHALSKCASPRCGADYDQTPNTLLEPVADADSEQHAEPAPKRFKPDGPGRGYSQDSEAEDWHTGQQAMSSREGSPVVPPEYLEDEEHTKDEDHIPVVNISPTKKPRDIVFRDRERDSTTLRHDDENRAERYKEGAQPAEYGEDAWQVPEAASLRNDLVDMADIAAQHSSPSPPGAGSRGLDTSPQPMPTLEESVYDQTEALENPSHGHTDEMIEGSVAPMDTDAGSEGDSEAPMELIDNEVTEKGGAEMIVDSGEASVESRMES